jgi:hypothetical protein
MITAQHTMAQDLVKVRGTVKDSVGGLPGVNITVVGTKIGTATDGDGNFKIEMPGSGTLLISSTGFATQKFDLKKIKPGANGTYVINATMVPDENSLTEVTV